MRTSYISSFNIIKYLTLKAILFLFLVWLGDLVIGTAIEKMYFRIETGTSGALINHLIKNPYEVYIMGASGAQHGYIPEIIEKETGLSVYNAGEDGTSIFYKYAILQLILEHNKPKLIIWDVLDLDYSYFKKYTGVNYIKPYHANSNIYELLKELDPMNVLLKVSRIYTYNQKIAAILTESVFRASEYKQTQNGYLPLYGEFKPDMRGKSVNNELNYVSLIAKRIPATSAETDLTRKYFNLFVDQCHANGIKLIAFTSPLFPMYPEMASKITISDELVNELKKKGIKVHSILPSVYPTLNRSDIFKDSNHLNHRGAQIMSQIVTDTIVDELQLHDVTND